MGMPKKLIIAAVCARPFVQAAARAGYEVAALDAFADEDTRRAARRCYRIGYEHGRFNAGQWMQALQELQDFEAEGLVYGSGFEAAPMLLETAGRRMPLVGNTAEVLRQLKTPRRFFEMLDALRIAYPQVHYDRPQPAHGWLMKAGGGSGGTHVRRLAQADVAVSVPDVYYQREIEGETVSVLFAAAAGDIRVVGFNSQWTAPAAGRPYRYGGAVSRAPLAPEVQEQLVAAVRAIAVETGLRGLNSLDAIVAADAVQVLEINPRLSATFELYCGADGGLFELHLQACAGYLSHATPTVQQARAQQIVYAPRPLRVPAALDWPVWAADLPATGSLIAAGDPLCSVMAEAEGAEEARATALEREPAVLAAVGNG